MDKEIKCDITFFAVSTSNYELSSEYITTDDELWTSSTSSASFAIPTFNDLLDYTPTDPNLPNLLQVSTYRQCLQDTKGFLNTIT